MNYKIEIFKTFFIQCFVGRISNSSTYNATPSGLLTSLTTKYYNNFSRAGFQGIEAQSPKGMTGL
jgi:hypothetical protein